MKVCQEQLHRLEGIGMKNGHGAGWNARTVHVSCMFHPNVDPVVFTDCVFINPVWLGSDAFQNGNTGRPKGKGNVVLTTKAYSTEYK